ncbi:MAG: response regulator [Peptoniphilaceae bacterium]|nr:response regulator [Peptoniphilaceae bacterium]MDY6018435.1 response regulator [Anaerococcus sp.]
MKIILLDDHKIFGESLSKLLRESEKIDLCTFVANAKDLFNKINIIDYDICILDININSNLTGFDILEELLAYKKEQKVVILSSYDYPMYRDRAYKLGAKDYISKSVGTDELLKRLENIENNNFNNKRNLFQNYLTNREIEILRELIIEEVISK